MKLKIIGILLLSLILIGEVVVLANNEQENVSKKTEEKIGNYIYEIEGKGQIEIKQMSKETNTELGIKKEDPVEGAWFEIYHGETGELMDIVKTNIQGIAISKKLPIGYYYIKQVEGVEKFQMDLQVKDVYIQEDEQIVSIKSWCKIEKEISQNTQGKVENETQQLKEKDLQNKGQTYNMSSKKLPRTGF